LSEEPDYGIAWVLVSAGEPKVVRGFNEFLQLERAFELGKSEEVRKALEMRARKNVQFWMQILGSKRGRPRDRRLRIAWEAAAELKRGGRSVASLARQLYPQEYLKNPRGVTDRLRKGIAAIGKGSNSL